MTSLVVLSSLVGVVLAGHALHASWTQIEQLRQAEVKAVAQIRTVIQSMNELSDVLQRYVQSWEAQDVDDEEPPDGYTEGDPLAAYSLLRHVAEGWTPVDDALHTAKGVWDDIESLASRADRELLPNSEDLAGASEAMVRLAHLYQLNVTSLAQGAGLLQEAMTEAASGEVMPNHHHVLSVSELASIGLVAVNKGYFHVGVEFLRAARARAATHTDNAHHHESVGGFSESFSSQRLDTLLNTAVKVHDHVLDMRGPRSLTHAAAPTPYTRDLRQGHGAPATLKKAAKEEEEAVLGVQYLTLHGNKTWMMQQRPLVEQLQVEQLCRGRDLRTRAVTSRLHCSYSSGGSPWLLLAPFRVEQVSLDPYMALVYGVLNRQEAAGIKQRTRDHLQAPHHPIKGDDGHHNTTWNEWSLKHVWLEAASTTPLERLGRRLSHLMGVQLGDHDSEPYMVADYGLGGNYQTHRDTHGPARTPPNPTHGERMATFLTYLHAPAAGGRTVFPWVGVGVEVVEGATLVWWNLLTSHEHDFLTLHAACPVLSGHKWIVTKWAGYRPQWQSQPCVPDPSKKIMLPWH